MPGHTNRGMYYIHKRKGGGDVVKTFTSSCMADAHLRNKRLDKMIENLDLQYNKIPAHLKPTVPEAEGPSHSTSTAQPPDYLEAHTSNTDITEALSTILEDDDDYQSFRSRADSDSVVSNPFSMRTPKFRPKEKKKTSREGETGERKPSRERSPNGLSTSPILAVNRPQDLYNMRLSPVKLMDSYSMKVGSPSTVSGTSDGELRNTPPEADDKKERTFIRLLKDAEDKMDEYKRKISTDISAGEESPGPVSPVASPRRRRRRSRPAQAPTWLKDKNTDDSPAGSPRLSRSRLVGSPMSVSPRRGYHSPVGSPSVGRRAVSPINSPASPRRRDSNLTCYESPVNSPSVNRRAVVAPINPGPVVRKHIIT